MCTDTYVIWLICICIDVYVDDVNTYVEVHALHAYVYVYVNVNANLNLHVNVRLWMHVCIYVSLCMYDLCIYSQSIWHYINGGDINRLRKRPGQSLVLRAWNLGSQSICDAPADETNDELLSRGADFPNWAVRAGNLEGDAWHFLQVGLQWWHCGIASAQALPIECASSTHMKRLGTGQNGLERQVLDGSGLKRPCLGSKFNFRGVGVWISPQATRWCPTVS